MVNVLSALNEYSKGKYPEIILRSKGKGHSEAAFRIFDKIQGSFKNTDWKEYA